MEVVEETSQDGLLQMHPNLMLYSPLSTYFLIVKEFFSVPKIKCLSLVLTRKAIKAKPHPFSNCINSLTGQRTGAFLAMECDNNNDIGNASVKALDNKLCSEACLPGEWQSAEHELCGV